MPPQPTDSPPPLARLAFARDKHAMSATLPALMPNENAVCLCTDRNMLIPALFVANAVKSHAVRSPNSFDLIVVAGSSEVTDAHRQWMEEHGILLCESIDTTRYDDIEVADKRLSPATLAKLFLAQTRALCPGHAERAR